MVKADLTRDYYGDLELPPTADILEIKKQFKKLALTYHPDRNPGRENDVTAKFQMIQSAHEVLTDPQERAKYDANRVRASQRYQSGGNQRGNPWSGVSSQFPTPPRPPTARYRPTPTPNPPPPSAGAQRYKNFETPRQSANQSAQEGAEARRSNYAAWENMKNAAPKPAAGQSSYKPPPPSREEGFNSRPPPTRFGSGSADNRRAQSTSGQNRHSFKPHTPGGDEPAAPKSAYFTQRNKPAQAPEPPPRGPPQRRPASPPSVSPQPSPNVDPLRQFREQAGVPFEPRVSTPYATQGGEKLNPFDSANMNRSKSTREPRDRSETSKNMPRAGSDSNLNSPQRAKSFAQSQSSRHPRPATTAPSVESDSSDAGPEIQSRPRAQPYQGRRFAKARSSTRSPNLNTETKFSPPQPAPAQMPNQTPGKHSRKPSLFYFHRWWHSDPFNEPPLNDSAPESSTRPDQTAQQANGDNSSMYGRVYNQLSPQARSTHTSYFGGVNLPTVSKESRSPQNPYSVPPKSYRVSEQEMATKYPSLFKLPEYSRAPPAIPPSGVSSHDLFPMEEQQRSVIDMLINSKNTLNGSTPQVNKASESPPRSSTTTQSSSRYQYRTTHSRSASRAASEAGSPTKERKPTTSEPQAYIGIDLTHRFWQSRSPSANQFDPRFNLKVDGSTFQRTESNGFSSSTENINTKFTPQEWDGKFEAGYFQPEQKAANMSHHPRTQSDSRARGRSPPKTQPAEDAHVHHPHSESEIPAQSSGGLKFSQEEWAGTFKPQSFMPPPPAPAAKVPARPVRKRSSIVKPTMGTAAVVDDDTDSSLEKPLFTGRKSRVSAQPSPEPMDIDTPPVFKPYTPPSGSSSEGLNFNTTSPKRPAASSQSASPTDQESLKVNFEDMNLNDIISSMDLPPPPIAPQTPKTPTEAEYQVYMHLLSEYMKEWDLFTSRIMLHLLARKNQNHTLADKRWTTTSGLETYRMGLREDNVVLAHLSHAREVHSNAIKAHTIIRERMKEQDTRPPRKKTY